jgi:hypothetical protein
MESMGQYAASDLSYRPALMTARIVPRSLRDVAADNIGQVFGART